MTVQEILTLIPRLTTRDQLVLIEALSRSLREGLDLADPDQRAERMTTVDQLYGAFNPTGQVFSDEDIERMRFEAIMDKHQ